MLLLNSRNEYPKRKENQSSFGTPGTILLLYIFRAPLSRLISHFISAPPLVFACSPPACSLLTCLPACLVARSLVCVLACLLARLLTTRCLAFLIALLARLLTFLAHLLLAWLACVLAHLFAYLLDCSLRFSLYLLVPRSLRCWLKRPAVRAVSEDSWHFGVQYRFTRLKGLCC